MGHPASGQHVMVSASITGMAALGALLGVVALGTLHATAGPLAVNGMRIGPSVGVSPYANNIGGGIGAHTDRVWGHPDGGATGQGPCARRTGQRLDKREPRRNCSTTTQ